MDDVARRYRLYGQILRATNEQLAQLEKFANSIGVPSAETPYGNYGRTNDNTEPINLTSKGLINGEFD